MSKLSAGERQDDDRIRFVDREGTRILVVDLSECTAREAEETARRVPDVVTAEPRGSVLILTDFKGSSFDSAALRAIKETAVFDKPFVKKSALVGTLSLPREFHDEMKKFSRRDFAIFGTREEAMLWLVQG
ncbi:MAG: hypothetical protein ACRD3P_10230 [Terriglobales bacterium]